MKYRQFDTFQFCHIILWASANNCYAIFQKIILRRYHHYPTTMDHSLLMFILHPRLSTVCLHLCHVWNMFETCCAHGRGCRSGNEIYNRSFFNRNYTLNLISSEHSLKHLKDLNTLQYSSTFSNLQWFKCKWNMNC